MSVHTNTYRNLVFESRKTKVLVTKELVTPYYKDWGSTGVREKRLYSEVNTLQGRK